MRIVVSIICYSFLFACFLTNGVCSVLTSFLSVTSSFSNNHPLEIECSYSVGGAFKVSDMNTFVDSVDFILKMMTSQRESKVTI